MVVKRISVCETDRERRIDVFIRTEAQAHYNGIYKQNICHFTHAKDRDSERERERQRDRERDRQKERDRERLTDSRERERERDVKQKNMLYTSTSGQPFLVSLPKLVTQKP